MAFVAGARQVGKTTLCRQLGQVYVNWDNESHRDLILAGPDAVARQAGLEELQERPPVIVFDGIHKYGRWTGSYTHFTLPTNREGEIVAGAVGI